MTIKKFNYFIKLREKGQLTGYFRRLFERLTPVTKIIHYSTFISQRNEISFLSQEDSSFERKTEKHSD